ELAGQRHVDERDRAAIPKIRQAGLAVVSPRGAREEEQENDGALHISVSRNPCAARAARAAARSSCTRPVRAARSNHTAVNEILRAANERTPRWNTLTITRMNPRPAI